MNDSLPKILENITNWDLLESPVCKFVQIVTDNWNHGEMGYDCIDNGKYVSLSLSTLGCSHNEEIIKTLEKTMFWSLYWCRSEVGGHYLFEIPLHMF